MFIVAPTNVEAILPVISEPLEVTTPVTNRVDPVKVVLKVPEIVSMP